MTSHQQIRSQFQSKHKIPFVATDHEFCHARDITWKLRAKQAAEHMSVAWFSTSWCEEVRASGTRDFKPFRANHLFLTGLMIPSKALQQLVRERSSIEGWQWIGDTQLHEDSHRY